ncbi:hypothetical protein QBC35DRAFT_525860 [Podospora australis]|uniref:Carbohydrate Esterase Family 3 n=1 Tax=Podospora australis TaxID=1536484 RepID=A0AAN7ACS3_9PEZI|nr:hypothetical protein QBC35DRAFT_525860 [Podospora australis]
MAMYKTALPPHIEGVGTAALLTPLYTSAAPGTAVKPGTKLRILCVGDSITAGVRSTEVNVGYRASTISNRASNSFPQRPNIFLVHAGTNDMNPNNSNTTEGTDPVAASQRLGAMIDRIFVACPDAVVLVAMIINTCREAQYVSNVKAFQALVPGVVNQRRLAGKHTLAVNFTSMPTSLFPDCLHPADAGYKVMGDYWFDFLTQVPKEWITAPVGPDPKRVDGIDANGGLDPDIPAPDYGTSPVQTTSKQTIANAAAAAANPNTPRMCNTKPHWYSTGKIAAGKGFMGEWKFARTWDGAGQLASGIGRDPKYVRLVDMNGDGKADYVWIDPNSGAMYCWTNNLPNTSWSRAGNNTNGLIAPGRGTPGVGVQLADLNGDGRADYLAITPETGAVRVWWNYGPDAASANGWKFVDGGQVARGSAHANWKTLRFPDINGDGRADYVYIGEGGSLSAFLNSGSVGGQDVRWSALGGIAEGDASIPSVDHLVFADIDGDGRDDYLIWEAQSGLTGYLNQRTQREGVPKWINQGGPRTLAPGTKKPFNETRLADMDGDGKADHVHVGPNGALTVVYNRGAANTTVTMDGLRFADIDGDGLDDYIWVYPDTGAPTVYINKGPDANDGLGWRWNTVNGGNPITPGQGPSATVQFGDINGDGKDDYLTIDPKTGALRVWLNKGPDANSPTGWRFDEQGLMATGFGRGDRVRIADIDGDGKDDYIFLRPNGGTTIYRNTWDPTTPPRTGIWSALPQADAGGIGQRPEEISFYDVNGDGKADYVWTSAITGKARVYYNNYPPPAGGKMWVDGGEVAGGVGTSGSCVRWATLQNTGRASYIAVNPTNGAIAAWLSGCDDLGPAP